MAGGMNGVGVMVGVSVVDGVSVMVGGSVIEGVNVMVGVSVMVGDNVIVGEGGKYRYATGSPNLNNRTAKPINTSDPNMTKIPPLSR